MKKHLITYEFDGKAVEFEFGNGDVMVNATQMAKAFGKVPYDFLKTEGVQKFIETWEELQKASEDHTKLLTKTTAGGRTFMHRVLALKFAAWLSPEFDVWVFSTIDKLLFGNTKKRIELLETKQTKLEEMIELENELRDVPKFQEYLDKKGEVMRLGKELKQNDSDLFSQIS